MVWPLLVFAGISFIGYQAIRVGPQVMARYSTALNAARGGLPYRHYEHSFLKSMTVEEARLILGLPAGYKHDELKKKHREMMVQFHTDVGGSALISQKINEAREVLEGKRWKMEGKAVLIMQFFFQVCVGDVDVIH